MIVVIIRAVPATKRRKPRELTAEQLEQKELIERLWAEGKTAREIAELVGWNGERPSAHISNYRRRGYDLPHRYDKKRIAAQKRKRWNGKTNAAKKRKAGK